MSVLPQESKNIVQNATENSAASPSSVQAHTALCLPPKASVPVRTHLYNELKCDVGTSPGTKDGHMAEQPTIKLSLLARRKVLPELPGQPAGTTFGIIWDACDRPLDCSCYIVEFHGRSRARIMALVTCSGKVFRTDKPLTKLPDASPDLAVGPFEDKRTGVIALGCNNGKLIRLSSYRGSFTGTMRETGPRETWNTERSLTYREFMATIYLRYCVLGGVGELLEQPDGASTGTDDGLEHLDEPVEIFADFQRAPLPDAIETLLYRIDAKERPSGIERYVRRVFSAIDLARLRSLASTTGLSLSRIERMNGFYLNFSRSPEPPDEDVAFLFGVEAALNRISRVLDRMGAGLTPVSASPTEEACAAMEAEALMGVLDSADVLLDSAREKNPWEKPGTCACQPGGEWDVRTRMAWSCEGLNLLVRLEYSFRCCVADGVMEVDFVAPTAEAMPGFLWDADASQWIALDARQRSDMAREHAARIAFVLAGAAFSSGLMIRRCRVNATGIDKKDVVDGGVFERPAYMATIGAFAKECARTPLLEGVAVERLRALRSNDALFDVQERKRYAAPAEDAREIPEALRGKLLADCASELEVMESADDPNMDTVRELRVAAQIEPARAEEGLLKLIEELQASCAAAEFMASGPVRTQYCENYLGRLVLPLLESDPDIRILRAPDALFCAQHDLVRLYMAVGAYERALPEAQRLLDLASTSMGAHFALISVLARLGRYEEVIEVAKHGLRVAIERKDIAYLFYRMAFAYWQCGDHAVALACYRMVPRGESINEMADGEMRDLMAEMGVTEMPEFPVAVAAVRTAGITVAPSDELLDHIGDLAVQLADSGLLFLSARCANGIWRVRRRDELSVTVRSMTI